MTTAEKLEKLREQMSMESIAAYIVATDDFHSSEYVGDYFKEREFLSGFTGSAGTLVILKNEAALWTDGRYFIQAEEQLNGSGIKLMKAGCEGVSTIARYLKEKLGENEVVGFDGRTLSYDFVADLDQKLKSKNTSFKYSKDLVDNIWDNRPLLPKKKVFSLDIKYTGMSRGDKLKKIREKMKEYETNVFAISALDEIAWVLNLRGNDIKCCPLFLAYMIIEEEQVLLFIDKDKLNDTIINDLKSDGVNIYEYNAFYSQLSQYGKDRTMLADTNSINYMALKSINPDVCIVDMRSPIQLMKAVKTKTEYENIRIAHLKDGIALTKFMYWLKKQVGKENITEISAAKKIQQLRQLQEGYIEESFEPIVAYKEHGAIVHYQATEETSVSIEPSGMLLVDTGGHYINGTTDITRTFVLGEISKEEKKHFTYVLMGNLNLGSAKFLYGTRGLSLDYAARKPLWSKGLDYNHGTGHGVGYLLNVHEGPNSFRWRQNEGPIQSPVLEEGMVTSNEPGFYLRDKYGIRHENLVLCLKDYKNEYGQFMKFETLTKVPFDVEGIDASLMNEEQIRALNEYHRDVYETIAPYLEEEEKEWLREATRKIG